MTGSHTFKAGTQLQRGHFESRNTNHAQGDYYIVSLDGSPLLATITSPLAGWVDRLNYNLGLYAQDSWTMKRLTLSGGVRLDFRTSRSTPTTTGQARGYRTGTSAIRKSRASPTGRT